MISQCFFCGDFVHTVLNKIKFLFHLDKYAFMHRGYVRSLCMSLGSTTYSRPLLPVSTAPREFQEDPKCLENERQLSRVFS